MTWFKRFFCRHDLVRVVRWHRDVLKPGMKEKILYVDDLNVCNLVRCQKCGEFLHTDQREPLRKSKPYP